MVFIGEYTIQRLEFSLYSLIKCLRVGAAFYVLGYILNYCCPVKLKYPIKSCGIAYIKVIPQSFLKSKPYKSNKLRDINSIQCKQLITVFSDDLQTQFPEEAHVVRPA